MRDQSIDLMKHKNIYSCTFLDLTPGKGAKMGIHNLKKKKKKLTLACGVSLERSLKALYRLHLMFFYQTHIYPVRGRNKDLAEITESDPSSGK